MKIPFENYLVKAGEFSTSQEFITIMKEIHTGIQCVTNNDKTYFLINPIKRGNGVFPIKNKFISYLEKMNWLPEHRMKLVDGIGPGKIDAVKVTSRGTFAVEWETGNVSSSHRALNKIAVGIIQRQIIGGVLIVPVKRFSRYLTDRVGNYEEIAPYFIMYQNLAIDEGVIAIIGIEHDDIDINATIIPKGKDGNAKKSIKKSDLLIQLL